MSKYTTELTTDFQSFESKEWIAIHISNDSDGSGDEVHIETTPDDGDTVITASEYTNTDMNSDGTLLDTLDPLPHRLRIEEVAGSWTVWVEAVNHPDTSFA